MDQPEFVHMKLGDFPEDVIAQYNLSEKVDNKVFFMIKVKNGMHWLPYTGIIVQYLLETRLKDYGYT